MVSIREKVGPGGAETALRRAMPLGAVLYPDLFHRRACEAMSASAARVPAKQDPAPVGPGTGSTPSTDPGGLSGCNAECA